MIRPACAAAVTAAVLGGCGDEPTTADLAPIASIELMAVPETLLTRQQVELEVLLLDQDGRILTDRPVTWESSDQAVVTVTAGGRVTALTPGTTTIRATAGDVADSARITARTLELDRIVAGPSVSCGLEASGDAWCWGLVGANGYGNGSLSKVRRHVPSRAAVGHRFVDLALVEGAACGIVPSGGVSCWGLNDRAQLGDGTTTGRGVPAPVPGLAGIVQLAAGGAHFCARSAAGGVSCWGDNTSMQTGWPERGVVRTPQAVDLPGPATDLSAGEWHSCAVVGDQGYCWGSDALRQLGHDTTYLRLRPMPAGRGDGTDRVWSEVEASNSQTCGRDVTGAVFCWGRLEAAFDNDTTVWTPIRRFHGLTAIDLASGWFLQCAVSDQQTVRCDSRGYPEVTIVLPGPVVAVAVAGSEACVLGTDGAVACELGTQTKGVLHPVPLPAPVVRLVASDQHACSLDTGGLVHCWANWDRHEPRRIFESHVVTGIYAASGGRVCATVQDGGVVCWDAYREEETTELTGGRALVSLGVGDFHTCGLDSAGAAFCWGDNAYGQLGDGTTTSRDAAVPVQGGHAFAQLTAGLFHTCGLTTSGALLCWGHGSSGSMGDDRRDESVAPVTVDGPPSLEQIAAGSWGACGLDGGGTAWCWPQPGRIPTASPVGGATGLVSIAIPCGLRATGEMLCWGANSTGWFGNGTYGVTTETAVGGGADLRFRVTSFGLWGPACGITLESSTYCWGESGWGGLGSPDDQGGLATLPLKLYGSP